MNNSRLPMPSFWAGKRVLVTGNTGFKGSWLTLWLNQMGAQVVGLSIDIPTDISLWKLAKVSDLVEDLRVDTRDFKAVAAVFDAHLPEIVFHMAAQASVLPSYEDPIETFSTNVMGTVNVLEAARISESVKAIVNVTSDKCYENREWPWAYRETEAMGGFDPYSCSKGCAELITNAYRSSFMHSSVKEGPNIALGSVRAGNAIGGGDWTPNRIITDSMIALVAGRKINVRNPAAIRPWQHVLDPLAGYMVLAEELSENGDNVAEAWNFGPAEQDAREVQYIADRLVFLWGNNAAWETISTDYKHETQFLKVDSSKSRARLGWKPRLNLDTALEWIVYWYKELHSGRTARELTLEQISNYHDGKI